MDIQKEAVREYPEDGIPIWRQCSAGSLMTIYQVCDQAMIRNFIFYTIFMASSFTSIKDNKRENRKECPPGNESRTGMTWMF